MGCPSPPGRIKILFRAVISILWLEIQLSERLMVCQGQRLIQKLGQLIFGQAVLDGFVGHKLPKGLKLFEIKARQALIITR